MPMRPTRKIIAEFIAVFLFGAIAGGLVTWSYRDTQLTTFMSKTADKPDTIIARINKRYADDYHLTPDELNRIQPTLIDMAQHIYQVRHQFGVDMLATMDDYHQKIAEQLTPDHRAAYEADIAERRKTISSMLLLDESSPSQVAK